MKVIYRILILLFVVQTQICFAQKVTNITIEQVGQTIQVSYNLDTESPCIVSLFFSTDNGSTWQGPLKKVSGDVGEKISSGNKKITWDVLSELDQLNFSGVVFKVNAFNPQIIIPNSFSPNGDKKNDILIIANIEGYPKNSLSIINRWGKEVYSIDGYNNTTKVFTGENCLDGIYFFILNLGDGESRSITGNLKIER